MTIIAIRAADVTVARIRVLRTIGEPQVESDGFQMATGFEGVLEQGPEGVRPGLLVNGGTPLGAFLDGTTRARLMEAEETGGQPPGIEISCAELVRHPVRTSRRSDGSIAILLSSREGEARDADRLRLLQVLTEGQRHYVIPRGSDAAAG